MSVNLFIDSNIFLYAFSDQDLKKHQIAKPLILQDSVSISTQVISEVSNNLLKKFGLTEVEVSKFIRNSFQRYMVAQLTEETHLVASELRQQYYFSYFDSTVVASALVNQCQVLYSEDMQHGLVIRQNLQILNPFASTDNQSTPSKFTGSSQ